jgi:hypothetical protein
MNGQECRYNFIYLNNGQRVERLTYPPNYDWMPADEFPENCRDCGVAKGGFHHEFCCMEDCPLGDGQLLSCAHGPHASPS